MECIELENNEYRLQLFYTYDDLVSLLYKYCPVGGSLHIITDDDNVKDSHLDFCEKKIDKDDNPEFLKHIMRAIIEILRSIRESERNEFINSDFAFYERRR